MNVFEAIERRARQRPQAPALVLGKRTLTYGQLVRKVQALAASYAHCGLRPGDLVGTSLKGMSWNLVVLLALMRLGVPFIVGHAQTPAARWRTYARHFGLSAVIGRSDMGKVGLRTLPPQPPARPGEAAPAHPGGEHLCMLSLTSGTTGAPKAVARTHAEILRMSAAVAPYLGAGSQTRFLLRMALTTSAMRNIALAHLCAGSALVFSESLEGALGDIDALGVTHGYVSPFMLARWLEALPEGQAPFRALRQLIVGGGALAPSLCLEAERRITPNIVVAYGATELGMGALADRDSRRAYPGSVGHVAPWIEAQAVDAEDRPLPPGETGILRFRGEGVASGYYRTEGGELASGKGWFRDGWCYPGDVGRVTGDRLLYIEGRGDDLVNLGGPKASLARVEAALLEHPAVAEAAAFGSSIEGVPQVVAAVVPRGDFDADALLRHCRRHGVVPEGRLRIVAVAELPRNAMGKVLKPELKAAIERSLGVQPGSRA